MTSRHVRYDGEFPDNNNHKGAQSTLVACGPLSAVGKMYVTCALLHNARVCCYGSTTSDYFDVSPPEIGDYFH